MKTLALFMMIILAINVSNASESAEESKVGMHEGAASKTATQCGARFTEQETGNTQTVKADAEVIEV